MNSMKKFKMFWNFDEEEKYLKDMARQGYILKVLHIWFLSFESGKPQNLNYKID